ncbi:Fic family protein [Herbiconiux sp.]|uniref:Fic family protein n=1 Tax=Herbiconiux sp. TaxID=1871186 RepID=UPI0025BCF9F1|nr:Fic family protein [Herbiconiux sp.]
MDIRWPAVASESVQWRSRLSPDVVTRRAWEEMQLPYQASIVPEIGGASLRLPDAVAAEAGDAAQALVRFDEQVGHVNAPFASLLLRSESASSSQIENLTSGARAIAEAEIGERSTGNAALILSNVTAMQAALDLADHLDDDSVIAMQRALLGQSRPDITGAYRDEQVWIGGSDHSPHRASFVPPVAERVPAAMRDLLRFTARTDLAVLPFIAVAHAQFETIHPFVDGNGRTGRALVQSLLRHTGVTRHVSVPLSAGLLQQRDRYFEALSRYREGDIVPVVEVFCSAAFAAVGNGRQLADDIADVRDRWLEQLSTVRRGSTAHRLVDLALEHPVLNSRVVEQRLGVPAKTALAALTRLQDAGVLAPGNSRARNRIWVAPLVIAALDAFAARSVRR